MNRPFLISVILGLAFLVVLQLPDIKDFLWVHPWLRAFLVALPPLAVAVVGIIVQRRLSSESDGHRDRANHLQEQANDLRRELDAERNAHLQQIARNTARELTPAERNAAILRAHIGDRVPVTEGKGNTWGSPVEIAEVKDDIVTLFSPRGASSSVAWCQQVHCGDLQVTNIQDSLRLHVLQRYGAAVNLGSITRWQDRSQPDATPVFPKGDVVYNSTYVKPGSPERRSLTIFSSKDGDNLFQLEASSGETATGDNKEISKRYMDMHIEYLAAGFTRNSAGTGAGKYPLFVS